MVKDIKENLFNGNIIMQKIMNKYIRKFTKEQLFKE